MSVIKVEQNAFGSIHAGGSILLLFSSGLIESMPISIMMKTKYSQVLFPPNRKGKYLSLFFLPVEERIGKFSHFSKGK